MKRVTEIIDGALKDKNEYSFRRRIVKRNGHLGFIETNAKIIRSECGLPTKIIGISSDVAGRNDKGVFEYNDPEFFDFFYKKYKKVIAYAVYNFVFDSELSQDLCQEIFLKAWSNMSQYKPEKGEIYTWLINITRNHCKDYLKTRHSILKRNSFSLDHAFNLKVDDLCDTSRMEVKNLLAQLPIANQELIDLLFIQGFTHQEVAHLKNMPLGSVKTKSRRTIGMLRKLSGVNVKLSKFSHDKQVKDN